jgi:hypothetical protein
MPEESSLTMELARMGQLNGIPRGQETRTFVVIERDYSLRRLRSEWL